MNVCRTLKFIAVFSLALVGFSAASPTASIFVKDAESFRNIKKDLESLKSGLGESNPEVDALLAKAERIAEMNDRCSMISINEVLDESCSQFYAVELPEFETKYMELTGELRLGSLSMGNSLAERTEQIKVCASALSKVVVSKEQLLKLNGSLDLEPLDMEGAFDATYNFNLFFDSRRMEQQRRMVDKWLGKCGDIILRKSGDEFAPLFLEHVKAINDSLKNANVNVKIVVEPDFLDFYLDLNKSVPGYYYLNGAQLFSVAALPTGRNYSHLIVNVPRRKVNLPLGTDGEMQNFKGRVEFKSVFQDKDLVGRWTWGLPKKKTFMEVKASVKEESTTIAEGDSAKLAVEARPAPKDTTVADTATPVLETPEKALEKDMAEQKAKADSGTGGGRRSRCGSRQEKGWLGHKGPLDSARHLWCRRRRWRRDGSRVQQQGQERKRKRPDEQRRIQRPSRQNQGCPVDANDWD